MDIIKSGGYKLSALEIEREILSHPQVSPLKSIRIMHKLQNMYWN
jgi:acyl-coenzyme A synthetase/AMP-(fatty) acid ligase